MTSLNLVQSDYNNIMISMYMIVFLRGVQNLCASVQDYISMKLQNTVQVKLVQSSSGLHKTSKDVLWYLEPKCQQQVLSILQISFIASIKLLALMFCSHSDIRRLNLALGSSHLPILPFFKTSTSPSITKHSLAFSCIPPHDKIHCKVIITLFISSVHLFT